MHTIPTPELTLRDLKQTMLRLQIKALETLERLMDDQELTGNEKTDKAKATERNRQRLAATQTLIHCRTMHRELREKREQSHRIRQDERAAQQKAPHQLATLRRLHKQSPDEYDNPDAPSEGGMAMQSMAMQDAKSAHNPEDIAMLRMAMPPESSPPSPLEGEGGRASGRMRGRSESSDQNSRTCGANPSPQPSPSRGEGAKPFPSQIGKALAAHIIAAGSAAALHPSPLRNSPHTG